MTTTTIEPRGPFSLRESATLGFGHRHDIAYDGVMRMAFCLDSYADAAGVEVRQDDAGVHVTALCPGYTKTDFHTGDPGRRAGLAGLLWLEAGPVAQAGLAAVAAGRPVCVPGAVYKTVIQLTRLVPRRVFRAAVRAIGRP